MKSTTSRRKHEVKASVNIPDLTKTGSSVTFKIYADDRKIGEISLGRGSIMWYGRNRRKRCEMSWSEFADMMNDRAYGK